MSETRLVFNGIDGSTGQYDLPPMTGEELSTFIRGEARPENLNELRYRHRQETERHLGVREGIDPDKLEEAGWGLILAHGADPAIVEALSELLELRQEQAGRFFQVFDGPKAYRPGESKTRFLARHGAGPGPADPEKVPYYLLIVGSPEDIPYRVQYELDVQYAVGRLHFRTLDEYANYARSVVMAERRQVRLPRRVSFFGVSNPDDDATKITTDMLIEPMYERLKAGGKHVPKGWDVAAQLRDGATKNHLSDLLGGSKTPALLMTGSHGVKFPKGHDLQVPRQGALLCQDWPGPEKWPRDTAIPPEHYFSGEDLADDASLLGLLAFFFACYGGGTPLNDDFSKQAFKKREAIAPCPFVAGLPTRMLGHPKGGALAVVGHIDRAWSFSYAWPNRKDQEKQTVVFESALDRLLKGAPVGAAMEYFDGRWAELSTVLSDELEDIEFGKQFDKYELAQMWTANNDARNYVILGDPAVRLSVAEPGEAPAERPAIEVSHAGGAVASPTGGQVEAAEAGEGAPGGAGALDLSIASPPGEAQVGAALLPDVDEELLTFTVSTYAAADVDHPTEAERKFRTTISLVGDVETALPAQIAAEDVPYLEWHQEMVVAAWRGRLEVLRLAAQIGRLPGGESSEDASDG